MERIRSAGKNIELRMLTNRSELKNHAAIRSNRKRYACGGDLLSNQNYNAEFIGFNLVINP
jgi:hypothetical protein